MGEPAVPAPGGERRKAMGEVVFEAGQRLRIRGSNVELVLVERDTKHGISPVWDAGDAGCWLEEHLTMVAELAAPVPRPGQRWECDTPYEVQIVDADGDISVEDYYHGWLLCRGTVVDVAKWLAEHGYTRVSEASAERVEAVNASGAGSRDSCNDPVQLEVSPNAQYGAYTVTLPPLSVGTYIIKWDLSLDASAATATIIRPRREPDIRPMASLASAVAEVFAPPTREASRRYVDMAVKALRYQPFAKAVQATLVSLVGDRISVFPTPNDIMATIGACHAWEHARGQIAPAKRTLSKAEAWELTEVAKLAAWARVSMRDASDIGEIVAETYERARATC